MNKSVLLLLLLCATPTYAQDVPGAIQHLNEALASLQPTNTATGKTTTLGPTADLQAALNVASCGDTILLPTAGVYTATLTGAKPCQTPITLMATYPTPIGKALIGASLPKLRPTPGENKTIDLTGNGYMLRGLDILGTYYDAVTVEGSNNSVDGNWIHCLDGVDCRRGIALNGINNAATRNAVTGIKEKGADSQGIAGWNGPGPYTIDSNYIEAASEGILFGGTDPSAPNLVPSSIVVSNNYITRPPSWRNVGYNVKNCFELKNAQHVTFTHNTCENVWHDPDGQGGYPLVLTVRNQEGHCNWCIVSDVHIEANVFRHAGAFINILAVDDTFPSAQAAGIVIRGNLAYDIDAVKWGGPGTDYAAGRLLQVLNGVNGLTIDHNTVVGGALNSCLDFVNGSKPLTGFTYTNNVTSEGQYSILGQGDVGSAGVAVLNFYAPGAVWDGNTLIAGPQSYTYPAGTTRSQPGQVVVNPDFTLATGFTGGADIANLKATIAGLDLTQ